MPNVMVTLPNISGALGDEYNQATECTGTDNQIHNDQEKDNTFTQLL